MHAPREPHAVGKILSVSFCFVSCFFGDDDDDDDDDDVAFSEYYVPLPFLFCMESTLYVFLSAGVFYLVHHGLYFDISLCENLQMLKISTMVVLFIPVSILINNPYPMYLPLSLAVIVYTSLLLLS